MAQYRVKPVSKPIDCTVSVPGSKSVTNRALLMAALSSGECRLDGVLFSDDSRHFLDCLDSLGFNVIINEEEKWVTLTGTAGKIPKQTGTINVGSAGTAARFLTAMLALSEGEYVIDASEQMKRRPMKPLFDALTKMGADFTYLENEGFLPVKVRGAGYNNGSVANTVEIDISRSTQFLSALMMVAPVIKGGLEIVITSEKTEGSYIKITSLMMKEFGCNVFHQGNIYRIDDGECYINRQYQIEPDVSAACYFYAAAAITGGRALVRHVHMDCMQGDIKFIKLLESMGCRVCDTDAGVVVTGCTDGIYDGIEVDMNDFSDQSMTLGAVAAFARTATHIKNIGHIRLQESDRLKGMATELARLGADVTEEETGIIIRPSKLHGAVVGTYEDHRMAMSFALVGLKTEGVIIDDYECCKKTFEDYFEVIEKAFY